MASREQAEDLAAATLALTFEKLEGEWDDRVAIFSNEDGSFPVYRFRNQWAYGSSAERFRLLQA